MNLQTYPFSQRSIATILPPPTQILYAIATKQYVLQIPKIEQLAIVTLQTLIPERNNVIPIVQNKDEQCDEWNVVGDAGEKLEEPALEPLILPEEGTQEALLPDEETPITEDTKEKQVETSIISSEKTK